MRLDRGAGFAEKKFKEVCLYGAIKSQSGPGGKIAGQQIVLHLQQQPEKAGGCASSVSMAILPRACWPKQWKPRCRGNGSKRNHCSEIAMPANYLPAPVPREWTSIPLSAPAALFYL
ncbi:hypothetical protein [Phyllobacterium myrsinacearum]|uniref:hypothetical protein n=1 Tax=Phyllobacterium myrsinacearum TaxID=28101 RepID=UPI001028913E|nr:hypothetical protein [Phyllobacterium myrsinacearum]